MILNDLLFYGGIIIIIVTLLIAVIFFIIYHIKSKKLNLMFDKEYGELSKLEKH